METSKYPLLLMCTTLVIAVVPGNSSSKLAGAGGLDEEYGGLVTYTFRIFHPSTRDTAFVYVYNSLHVQIFIWIQSKECYQCELILLGPVTDNGKAKLEVDTSWVVTMRVTTEDTLSDDTTICKRTDHFRQFGNYTWYVNLNASSAIDCSHMILLNNPADAFLPIYIAISVMTGLAVLYICVKQLWSYEVLYRFLTYLGMERVVSSDLGTPSNLASASASESNSIQRPSRDKPNRLKSLDAFRGMSLVVMIFVNYDGGGYWFFKHSPWNGLTVADLVFPWFVFIMGVSITLSFHTMVRRDVTRRAIFFKVFKRFLILFGLGIILQGGTDLAKFRVPGVLQRIAVSYFVVASIHIASASHKDEEYKIRYAIYRELRDILDYWYEWLIMLSLLVLHLCLTFLLPVPGCPTGYLGPGGPLVGNNSSVENCTGGAANYIDKVILTYNHIYPRGTPQKIYHNTVPHDPEGILGTLTSIFMTFLGLQAGKIFYLFSYPRGRILRLLAWCIITGVIAGALCDFSKEGGVIPSNKNLWSVSFILATSSMAFILLAAFYYLIDVQHWWTGVPFYFIGMNSIVVYCGHEVLGGYFPFSWTPIHGTHAELLPMNLIGASLWLVIAYYMYSIKFFVKI